MKRYVVAVGHRWGLDTFAAVRTEKAQWDLVQGEEALHDALINEQVPEFVFFLNWSMRVPADIVGGFTCVNFHCTPLPYGRGGHPIENMILRGHAHTVIVAHRMTDVIDGGPIYLTSGNISLKGKKEDILARFVEPVARMIRLLVRTRHVAAPQIGQAVKFARLSPDEYREFWKDRQ